MTKFLSTTFLTQNFLLWGSKDCMSMLTTIRPKHLFHLNHLFVKFIFYRNKTSYSLEAGQYESSEYKKGFFFFAIKQIVKKHPLKYTTFRPS